MTIQNQIKKWQKTFWRILIRKTGIIEKLEMCEGKDKEDSLVDFCCLGGAGVARKYEDIRTDDERDM